MRLVQIFAFLLLATSCASENKIANYESSNKEIYSLNEGTLDSLITPYRSSMDAVMNRVIGKTDSTLVKFNPESPLGNFAADVVFKYGSDFLKNNVHELDEGEPVLALLNFGGLRTSINQGDITVGNIYELMPFDNTIVIVELIPDDIARMLMYLQGSNGQPTANGKFKLGDQNELWIGGEKYEFDHNVFVITSNYLADGGDKMDFLTNPVNRWETGIFIRDAFLQHIEENNGIGEYPEMGRIEIE